MEKKDRIEVKSEVGFIEKDEAQNLIQNCPKLRVQRVRERYRTQVFAKSQALRNDVTIDRQ